MRVRRIEEIEEVGDGVGSEEGVSGEDWAGV